MLRNRSRLVLPLVVMFACLYRTWRMSTATFAFPHLLSLTYKVVLLLDVHNTFALFRFKWTLPRVVGLYFMQ